MNIYFHIAKATGEVKVRYRLSDGRAVQICHKSDITCDYDVLKLLNPDGSFKKRETLKGKVLSEMLRKEYQIMLKAYDKMKNEGLDITSDVFEREISAIKNPIVAVRAESPNVVARFRKYAESSKEAGIIGEARYRHIIVVSDKLERFLIINGISGTTIKEFDIDRLLAFRNFLFDEFKYVEKHKTLYKNVPRQNIPTSRLSMNTVTSQLKMFQTFFSELEDRDEIHKSPFRMLGKERRKAIMKTKYDDPIFLRKEELQAIMKAKVPASLQDTKDAFLVNCAFGCRISDFVELGMTAIAVSKEGIPFIHYIPKKTVDEQSSNAEIETPIVRYAFDIIMRTKFIFPILRNINGTYGYNSSIRSLLQFCKIDREVSQFNETTKQNDYVPLYSVASSKLARKTHVDILNKVQINKYAAGLHKEGSSAVDRYTNLEIEDRFVLMNAAFEQEDYRVDKELSIIR